METQCKAFGAISQFVNDLWEVFGNPKKISPLALYRRLIQHINKDLDKRAIERVITPFQEFVRIYSENILSRDITKIPRGEKIHYGDNSKIYIDIESFIHRGDSQTKLAISQHLLTIYAILDPCEKVFQELEKSETLDGKEGEFLNNILSKAKSSVQNVDTNNPAVAFTALANSGVVGELFSGLQQGLASGEMDFKKMLGGMQSLLNNMMEEIPEELPEESKTTIEELPDESENSQEIKALPPPQD